MKTRRAKLFGAGKAVPLCREAKSQLMHRARSLVRSRRITAKAYLVFEALLWGFHNTKDGRCFPSYERIAELTGCSRSTVALAIKALELQGLLTWHIRLVRVRVSGVVKLIRTSNAYQFISGIGSQTPKSDFRIGTPIQSSILFNSALAIGSELPDGLSQALSRLGSALRSTHK